MMLIAWILNALALGIGVILGARALIDPRWAAKLVRLNADEKSGGFAEFRATYGGLFLGAHAAALALTLQWLASEQYLIGVAASGAAAVLAAAWGATAFGRALAMWRDAADTRFNRVSTAFELLVAAAIGGPWLLWALG